MAQDTIRFSLEGDVSDTDLRTMVDALVDLVQTLTEETDEQADVRWIVCDWRVGTASLAFRGEAESDTGDRTVATVVDRYRRIAEDVANARPIADPSPVVRQHLARLTSLVNGRKGRMGVDHEEWVVDVPISAARVVPPPVFRFDGRDAVRTSVKGTVVMLDRKRGLYFMLREAVSDRLIRCYPGSELKDKLAELWRTEAWVLVEGTLTGFGGIPTLTDITEVAPLVDAAPGGWRKAVGIAPRRRDGLTGDAADVVRRVRDG